MPTDPPRDGPAASPGDRRNPDQQTKRLDGRRRTDCYWTVAEIARDLGVSRNTVWRKYLNPPDGPQLLRYYDFGGEIRVDRDDYLTFKQECLRDRTVPLPDPDRDRTP